MTIVQPGTLLEELLINWTTARFAGEPQASGCVRESFGLSRELEKARKFCSIQFSLASQFLRTAVDGQYGVVAGEKGRI